ncbi:MAG: 50S ribosomal protein L25 [Lentisphaerae bacterium]|nr:50S ribosomal protein L25 [Lentisphaerota bacterium]
MSKAENVIAAQLRNEFGDNASRRLRKSGFIPAVIYGKGEAATAISVKAEEWQVASARKLDQYVIALDGKEIAVKVQEVQYNHLKDYVYHVDFVLA